MKSSRLLKIFLIIITISVLTLAGLIAFINPNIYKKDLSNLVYSKTGNKLEIAGDLKWRLVPNIEIYMQDVTLENTKGLGSQFYAAEAKVKIKPLDLIFGKTKLDLTMNNGQFIGINIPELLKYTETTLNTLYISLKQHKISNIDSLLSETPKQTKNLVTNFDKLTLSSQFNNGVSNNTNFNITNKDYELTGSGSINLPHNQIDMKINALNKGAPQATTSPEIAKYIQQTPIALIVRGDLDKPTITPDLHTYLQTAFKQLQRHLVKDFAADIIKKINPDIGKQLMNSLFKKQKPE